MIESSGQGQVSFGSLFDLMQLSSSPNRSSLGQTWPNPCAATRNQWPRQQGDISSDMISMMSTDDIINHVSNMSVLTGPRCWLGLNWWSMEFFTISGVIRNRNCNPFLPMESWKRDLCNDSEKMTIQCLKRFWSAITVSGIYTFSFWFK